MSAEELANWHRADWMQTFTGRKFYPLAPIAADVDPLDIAHSLAMLCRYNGHVQRFYSVAEHCVLISRVIEPEFALWALLHDATEAYVGDMVRPLKIDMPDYRLAEAKVSDAIAERFGLDYREPPRVKELDSRILLDEKAALLGTAPDAWAVDGLEPLGVAIEGWSPARGEREYLTRLNELGVEAPIPHTMDDLDARCRAIDTSGHRCALWLEMSLERGEMPRLRQHDGDHVFSL